MQGTITVDQIRDWVAARDRACIVEGFERAHPGTVAEAVADLEPDEILTALSFVRIPVRAEIFGHLDDRLQVEIARRMPRDDLAPLIAELPPDERVDLLKRMPDEEREAILPAIAQAEREDIRRLAAYPEGTAGAAMTSEYARISPDLTASEAIHTLRREAPNKETIYYAYVVDRARRLLGFVSLKDLILALPETRVELLMHRDVISVRVDETQEEAAQKIQKYDFIALPVVDANDVLVGIITYDDALDILNEEFTEDIEKLMAITGGHEGGVYLRSSVWEHFRHRSGWVLALALLGLVSGFIVHRFEGLLLQFSILATFMPMLVDTGGNTGSQSATLVVRALALREVVPRDAARILFKELQISLLLGALLAGIAFGRVYLFGDSGLPPGVPLAMVGVAVATALAIQVVFSTLIGACLPLFAAKLRIDPAVVASPALTTIVDITGLMIFFTTAKLILGL